ncbi:MAG: S41 family peptidase, partial [Bacteroidales bacterium]|nr:S41 family peptidase [Bacteroidales bacterium]
FTYKGDIYTVPATGGKATQITTNPAHDTHPVWSPDGKKIAFASDRMGSMDIYEVSKEGGTPLRLTTHSGNETPLAYKDNGHILFQANVMPSAEDVQFPSGQFPQVYEVSTEGGRPTLFSSMPMEDISVNAAGNALLYHDRKGYEDAWRKHHTSSITRDIWLCSLGENGNHAYRKLTGFNGEDRTPVWAPDNRSFYYLSEEKGSFNIFKRDIDGNSSQQITHHTKHPVRFLTAASNGTLCYGYDGEIYTVSEGAEPKKVNISIITDKNDKDLIRQIRSSGAREIALSPDAKEVAFILRGDIYVTSVEYKTTKQITNTPQQERGIEFSPDGRSLVYASERNGLWQIYQTSLTNKEEKQFAYATGLKEERLTNSDVTSFQPQYSPDGKEVAFLENRTTIRVLNLATKAVRTVMDGKYEYSYSDGDQWYQWSPDSKWILTNYIGIGGWNNKDVALVNASGNGEIHNLTESGYTDTYAKWVLDGKAMIWESDRAGYRSHGSWGAESDIYIMFFDLDAYDRFRMSKEELALVEEAEKKDKDKEKDADKADKKDKKKDAKKDEEKKEVKPLTFDLENCKDRVIRLTVNSSRLGDAVLTPKGDKLYYQAAFESGYDLWEHDLKENKTKIVLKSVGGGSLLPDKEGEHLFLCSGGGIKKVTVSGGDTKSVDFEAFFNYQPYEERQYIFDHVWQQVEDKFYVPDLHGTDWKGYREAYARFLPYINNNYDFQELLSEMLGELNGSHTGARYYAPGATLSTAALGVFYDETYDGDGLKIKEILAKGPFAVKKTDVTPGCIIEKIDGQPIVKGQDYFPLLEGKAGRKVLLAMYNPATGKRFDVTVKAISTGEQSTLLYKRWVERCRQTVDKLSEGRVGYVHVKGMDSQSFREVYSELLGRCRNKEAVIVDTRHNGGGWLHDDLATLLSGKEYQRFMPRGQYIGSDPFNKWLKPSCVLMCEDNYSNAHGFPWVYKELKIGKLIGTPVPGTMTAVWWETQIDPTIVFGIPQVGCMDMRGQYAENHQLSPDIEVYNAPEKSLQGEDQQLEAAVQEMLKTIGNK